MVAVSVAVVVEVAAAAADVLARDGAASLLALTEPRYVEGIYFGHGDKHATERDDDK